MRNIEKEYLEKVYRFYLRKSEENQKNIQNKIRNFNILHTITILAYITITFIVYEVPGDLILPGILVTFIIFINILGRKVWEKPLEMEKQTQEEIKKNLEEIETT